MSNYSKSSFNYSDNNTSWFKSYNLIKDHSLVLDVGCSVGTFGAELINKKGCTVDGIEIDEEDLAQAKKKLRNVYNFNLETDTLLIDTRYDYIFMGDVVEHLASPVKALIKLRKLLKQSGKLIFSIPNITHMSVRLMLLEGKIEYGKTGLLDETHLHFYNQEEIYRVFNKAGYKIVNFDFTVNDIPEDLINRKLKALGLSPTKEFYNLLKSTNAAAYQFIGEAEKSNIHKYHQLPKSSPQNIVENYIKELKEDYLNVINGLQKNLEETANDRDRILLDRDRILAEQNKPVKIIKRIAREIKNRKL